MRAMFEGDAGGGCLFIKADIPVFPGFQLTNSQDKGKGDIAPKALTAPYFHRYKAISNISPIPPHTLSSPASTMHLQIVIIAILAPFTFAMPQPQDAQVLTTTHEHILHHHTKTWTEGESHAHARTHTGTYTHTGTHTGEFRHHTHTSVLCWRKHLWLLDGARTELLGIWLDSPSPCAVDFTGSVRMLVP